MACMTQTKDVCPVFAAQLQLSTGLYRILVSLSSVDNISHVFIWFLGWEGGAIYWQMCHSNVVFH